MSFARISYRGDGGWFNSVFRPFDTSCLTACGRIGFDVVINLPADCRERWRKRALSGVADFLYRNGVTAIVGETVDGFYKANGNMLAVLDSAKGVNVSDEIVIIGGERNYTETVLCVICPHVNYVSVISESNYLYRDTAEFFFKEYGINIQFINTFLHENFRNADVVINCAKSSESYDHLLKKGCVYYDVMNDKKRLEHIRRIRSDVTVVSPSVHELTEAVLYSSSSEYRRLAGGDINCREKLELIENIRLSKLTSIKR